MTADEIAQVKATPIEDVVTDSGLTVVGTGRIKTTREHDSLRLFTMTNTWYWFSQGQGGDVIAWVQYTQGVDFLTACHNIARRQGGKLPTTVKRYIPEPPPPDLPAELHLQMHSAMNADDIEWWFKRGIAQDAQAHFKLGVYHHPAWGLCYSIPVIENGKLVNIRLRIANPPNPKDKYRPYDTGRGTHLYNSDILTPDTRGVVIVAGELKAVALWQDGIPAVSPTAGCQHWRPEWTERLNYCQKVYIAFDPGEEKAGEELAEQFGDRARFVVMPDKPDDLMLGFGPKAIRYHLQHALPLHKWRKARKVQVPLTIGQAFYDPQTYMHKAADERVPWRRQLLDLPQVSDSSLENAAWENFASN